MKRLIVIFALILAVTAASLASCDKDADRYAGFSDWSKEMETEIKQAYWLTSRTDLNGFDAAEIPMYYLGTYSGYAAVLPDWVANDVVIEKTLGGHEFKYGNSNVIIMYKDGAFADPEAVFNEGKITQDDVDRIYEKYMSIKANE